jgi:hypothetical protein
VTTVFKSVKKASRQEKNPDFVLVQDNAAHTPPNAHLIRYIATIKGIFDDPVFEVSYLFSKWDLEGNILGHYRSNDSKPYDAKNLFRADSARVKIFVRGEMRDIVEQEFRKNAAKFESFSKGFTIQDA